MGYCVMCGSPIPDNQGSNTCSMCYGDPGHGKDGYYQQWLEQQALDAAIREEESKLFNEYIEEALKSTIKESEH
jgi:hypothetical protein